MNTYNESVTPARSRIVQWSGYGYATLSGESDMSAATFLRESFDSYSSLVGGERATRLLLSADRTSLSQAWERGRTAPDSMKTLLQLFLFGHEVPMSSAERSLSVSDLNFLVERTIIEIDGRDVRSNFLLLPIDNGALFIPHLWQPERSPGLYIGSDSFRLVDEIRRRKQVHSCLEIGPGTGICALAGQPERYEGVDIAPAAVKLANVNFELNACRQRFRVHLGDSFNNVSDNSFDLIISNPPFVPCPTDGEMPRFSNGGPDGLGFLRAFVRDLPAMLEGGASCILVLTAYGDAAKSSFEDLLPTISTDLGVSLRYETRSLIGQEDLAAIATGAFGKASDEHLTVVEEHFSALGYTHLYQTTVEIRPGCSGLEIHRPTGGYRGLVD